MTMRTLFSPARGKHARRDPGPAPEPPAAPEGPQGVTITTSPEGKAAEIGACRRRGGNEGTP